MIPTVWESLECYNDFPWMLMYRYRVTYNKFGHMLIADSSGTPMSEFNNIKECMHGVFWGFGQQATLAAYVKVHSHKMTTKSYFVALL